ncbi:hypothetical protein [Nitrosopumilus sp.]|uniref:hypothetical protein n=1 Tax=Nitrosopumilus sp. TaxID=2024843 RepID=UPI00247D5DC1|nr:hypothetical protein [Nitrosopumilus sp.]MCV0430189.1 hypothetical protein [Nitrosopumilus sp.]
MNSCNNNHNPLYKIKYKTTRGNVSEWVVCEQCFGKQDFFACSEEIESIVSLRDSSLDMKVEQLSILTEIMTKKLRKILLVS